MNPDELKQASEVMRRAADGEVVERRLRLSSWDKRELCLNQENVWGWNWDEYDYRILDFPPPPDSSAWHNPAGLNATQVGVHQGWRLLLDSEIDRSLREDTEEWGVTKWLSLPHGCPGQPRYQMLMPFTFRTKSPLPSPKVDACTEACKKAFPDSWNTAIQTIWSEGWNAARAHFTKQS